MRFAQFGMMVFMVLPLVVAAVLITGVWLRRRAVESVGQRRTVEKQLKRTSPYLRAAKGIAIVIGTIGLVLAASRPQYGGRIQMLKKRGIDIVVALDFSKSMLARDAQPSRIERAKLELGEFIEHLTGDRIGLVAFAGDTMQFPLTTDYAAATTFWKGMGPYDMPVGGTAIGKALTVGVRMLRPKSEEEDKDSPISNAQRSKVIVLITDGEDHLGDPLAVANEAADKGIKIHVLGIGSDSPEPIPRRLDDGSYMGWQKDSSGNPIMTALSRENEDTLKEISAKTGGRYYRAGSDLSGMASVVSEIRKMKQTEVEARQITVYEEVYQWFLGPALLLLFLGFGLPARGSMLLWRRR